MPKLSIVVPVYNESLNLPVLYQRIRAMADKLSMDWELIAVDDHSADDSFAVLMNLSRQDGRVRAVRLARNGGSHAAMTCGLKLATGDCGVVLAADLQDPPEVVPEMIEHWRGGAHIVWAVRERREGETLMTRTLARIYYWIMRHLVGIKDMPSTGADFFVIDRLVIDSLQRFEETNISIMALLTWLGYQQVSIPYVKQARLQGHSGWTLHKKLKLAVDSVVSFTYLPIRVMSYLGFLVAVGGFGYAIEVVTATLRGRTVEGWSSLMVVLLVLGGMQMLMMGVLGEYLWRALDEARRRPRYLIEASTDMISHRLSTPRYKGDGVAQYQQAEARKH